MCRVGPQAALRFTKIPQRPGEEGHHAVLVEPCRVSRLQPAMQRTLQRGELWKGDLVEGGSNERALTGPPGGKTLGLEFAIRLEHRVRVDGQRGDRVSHLWELVAGFQIAEPQRVLDLLNELEIGGHPGPWVEPEFDGGIPPGRSPAGPLTESLNPLSILIRRQYSAISPCQGRSRVGRRRA